MAFKSKSGSGGSRKALRSSSNVFAMFEQYQIQEFKEAFQLIDSNKDGFIDKEDLRYTFDSLGRLVKDGDLADMVAEAQGPITFTVFLTIFGERIAGTDPEDVLVSAFKAFDGKNLGKIDEKTLKRSLCCWGDKLNEDEVEEAFCDAPVDRQGLLDYMAFTRLITRGKEDDDGTGPSSTTKTSRPTTCDPEPVEATIKIAPPKAEEPKSSSKKSKPKVAAEPQSEPEIEASFTIKL